MINAITHLVVGLLIGGGIGFIVGAYLTFLQSEKDGQK